MTPPAKARAKAQLASKGAIHADAVAVVDPSHGPQSAYPLDPGAAWRAFNRAATASSAWCVVRVSVLFFNPLSPSPSDLQPQAARLRPPTSWVLICRGSVSGPVSGLCAGVAVWQCAVCSGSVCALVFRRAHCKETTPCFLALLLPNLREHRLSSHHSPQQQKKKERSNKWSPQFQARTPYERPFPQNSRASSTRLARDPYCCSSHWHCTDRRQQA